MSGRLHSSPWWLSLGVVSVLGLASPGRAEPSLGVGMALLARQQASGNDFVTVSPQLRAQYAFARFFQVALTYDFAYQGAASAWGMRVDSHQASLRAVGRLWLTSAAIDLELGPSLRFDHAAVLSDSLVVVHQHRFAPGVAGGLFVSVPLQRFEVRLGSEVQRDARWDVRFSVGLVWRPS